MSHPPKMTLLTVPDGYIAIYGIPGLTANERIILVSLFYRHYERPSAGADAAVMAMSPSTAYRSYKRLASIGLVTREDRRNRINGRRSTRYRLNMEALVEMRAAQQ